MKKTITFITSIAGMILLGNFSMAQNTEPKYVVAQAWEQPKTASGRQPVITNVAYFNCKKYGSREAYVEHQLNTYYDSEFKRSRNTLSIRDVVVFVFDTRDKAEAKRRELIAKVNDGRWTPVLMERFSVLCEN
jgi:hypothetical protein